MPVRHMNVTLSAVPTTAAIKIRLMSLIMQNVTDFSGYTTDPTIGSWLGSNTITVEAYGDNLSTVVVSESASEVIIDYGATRYKLSIQSGANVIVGVSYNGGANYVSSLFMAATVSTYRIADSYYATAYFASGVPSSSAFVTKDLTKTISLAFQSSSSTALVSENGVSLPFTIVSNYGPVVSGSFLGNGFPALIKETYNGIYKKPLFKLKLSNDELSEIFDLSSTHGILATNYGAASEYADVVTTGGTNYRAVGRFIFPS